MTALLNRLSSNCFVAQRQQDLANAGLSELATVLAHDKVIATQKG